MCDIIFSHIFRFILFSGIFYFLCANINALEDKRCILPENSACYSVRVSLTKLTLVEIRVDDRRLSEIHSRVYKIIQRCNGKLICHFRSEIVDNEKITFKIFFGKSGFFFELLFVDVRRSIHGIDRR